MSSEIGHYVFRVGEGPTNGKPVFIWLELQDQPPISVFENALVTLQLRDKDDFENAKRVADFLNEQIEGVGYQPS